MTVAALEFRWDRAEPTPRERREELLGMTGMGASYSDHMVTARWRAGPGWHDARIQPLAALPLHPATMALHYGQTVFEGLKAFWRPNGQRAMFRPTDHARRFNHSAHRMAMPTLPEETFVATLEALLRADGAWVPSARGSSFYLRPFMIAAETHLSNRPAEEYLFAVIGSPARPASAAAPKPMRLWAATDYVRAAEGGTGAIKCGGNYGGSYLAQRQAVDHGCDQVVWLDARERRYVEEVGGSNLFFVESVAGGARIVTPPLRGTLLAGITRDSVLRLAQRLGYQVAEEPVTLDDWERGCRDGRMTEAFACGTARAVAPVGHVAAAHREWTVADGEAGPVTLRLREALLDIQYGKAPDEFGWTRVVDTDGEGPVSRAENLPPHSGVQPAPRRVVVSPGRSSATGTSSALRGTARITGLRHRISGAGHSMNTDAMVDKASRLRALHAEGTLVLPNAWDAASAAVIADAGAAAIATTSAGLAWSLGRRDGEQLPRTELVDAITRIAAVVDVPLTADIETGYGATDEDVAETVAAVLGAGAVGINIEDAPPGQAGLYTPEVAAARIRAARTVAVDCGVPDFVINARTDVYLRQIGSPETRPGEVLHRARAYADAGGDCLFVPGLSDLAAIESLVALSPLPVNVSAGPGKPTVAQLRAAGVRRVSVGPALTLAAYTVTRRLAEELLTAGLLTTGSPQLGYGQLNSLFPVAAASKE